MVASWESHFHRENLGSHGLKIGVFLAKVRKRAISQGRACRSPLKPTLSPELVREESTGRQAGSDPLLQDVTIQLCRRESFILSP